MRPSTRSPGTRWPACSPHCTAAPNCAPPYGLTLSDAVACNERLTFAEGVRIDPDGDVHFSPSVREGLRPHLPQLCEGFSGAGTARAAAQMWHAAQVLRRREDPADAVYARGSADGVGPCAEG